MKIIKAAAAVLAALCLMTGCSGSPDSRQEETGTETAETTELTGGGDEETEGEPGDQQEDEPEDKQEDEPEDKQEDEPEDRQEDEPGDRQEDGPEGGQNEATGLRRKTDDGSGEAEPDDVPATAPADPTKLQVSESEEFKDGFFYCEKLGEGIEVTAEKSVSDAYMEKCAEAVKNMPQTTLTAIWEGAKKTCLAFIEQEREAQGDSFESLRTSPRITADTPAAEMAKYIRLGEMQIFKPADEKVIGYELNGSCEWDLEQGFEVVILSDRVIYAGAFSLFSPWNTEPYTTGDGAAQNHAQ